MSMLARKIAAGAVWATAETWGRQVTNFVLFAILARLLGAEAYGLVALALLAPAIASVVVMRGLPEAIVQRRDLEALHLDSSFWLVLGMGCLLSALVWALADPIAAAFDAPGLAELVRWTSAIVGLNALAAVSGAMLRRQLRFRTFAVRSLIGTVAGGAVGLTMALTDHGVWSLVGLQLTRSAVEAAVLLVGAGWLPRLVFSFRHCRDLFGFSWPLVVQSFVNMINDELPKAVLGLCLGPQAVGIYAIARRMLDFLVEALIVPLSAIGMPSVARMQTEPAKIRYFFDTSLRLAALAGVPAFVGLATVAPELVPLVFGEELRVAVPAVQILMLVGVQRTIDTLCATVLLALGHSPLLLRLNLIYFVMALVLLPIGATFGVTGAITALVLCQVALLPVFLVQTARQAGVDVGNALRTHTRILVAAASIPILVHAWRALAGEHLMPVTVIVSSVAIGVVAYGAALLLLARTDLIAGRKALVLLRR